VFPSPADELYDRNQYISLWKKIFNDKRRSMCGAFGRDKGNVLKHSLRQGSGWIAGETPKRTSRKGSRKSLQGTTAEQGGSSASKKKKSPPTPTSSLSSD
jgi:hypothetical protein